MLSFFTGIKTKTRIVYWVFTWIAIFPFIKAIAQDYDTYYLSIGSETYQSVMQCEHLNKKKCYHFENIEGAGQSALHIANMFETYAKAKGIILVSQNELRAKNSAVKNVVYKDIVEKNTILTYLDSLTLLPLKRTDKQKPTLGIFYYCGHGLSTDAMNNSYFVPGDNCNCTYDSSGYGRTAENFDSYIEMDTSSKKTMYARSLQFELLKTSLYARLYIDLNDITDLLKKSFTKYIIISDCCLDGDKMDWDKYKRILGDDVINSLRSRIDTLKYINEHHDSNPVVFSAKFGNAISTVESPLDSLQEIGPLCRRILKIKYTLFLKKKLSIYQFVDLMRSKKLDKLTNPAVSYFKGDNLSNKVLFKSK